MNASFKMKKIIQNNILYTRRGLSTSHRPAVTTYFVPYNLSVIQRAFLIPYFGIGAISDPRRGDLVAGLGDATSEWHLKRMKNQLMTTSSGRKLMLEKPLITNESIRLLSSSYREGSLGEKYTEFMKVQYLILNSLQANAVIKLIEYMTGSELIKL